MDKPFLMIMINYCVEKPANKPSFTRSKPVGFVGDFKILESFATPSYFVTVTCELEQAGSTEDLVSYLYGLTAGKLLLHATAMLYLPESGPTVFHSTSFGWEEVTSEGHSRLPVAINYALNKPVGGMREIRKQLKRKAKWN